MPPIRKCRLRALLDTITSDETDRATTGSIKIVKKVLQNLRYIDEENDPDRIKYVDETFMGARIFNVASNVAYECILNVNYAKHNFDPNEFIDKFMNLLTDGQPEDYSENLIFSLTKHVDLDSFMTCLNSYSSIYGGSSNKPFPPSKPRKQFVKEANLEQPVKKHLQKVTEFGNVGDKKSDDILKFHLKILNTEYKKNQKEPVDYYEFVIDTKNFGTTVENIFYTSFNLNDGKVKLILDDADNPQLEPIDKKKRLNLPDSESMKKLQMVTSITMGIWQSHCARFETGLLQKYRERGLFEDK